MGLAKLLILAEERLVGRGLASLLESRFETHTIESFQRANRLLGSDQVEVALWVGERLDESTVAQLEDLKAAHPGLRLCLLARAANPDALRPLLTDDACGIAVMLRSDELDEDQVLACLETVLAGRATLERSVLRRLVQHEQDQDDPLARLTESEQEILELVAQGLRNCEIAKRVWRSEKAVEKQVSNVFEKFGLDRRSAPHLDRRVTAARIFFICRPQSVDPHVPNIPAGDLTGGPRPFRSSMTAATRGGVAARAGWGGRPNGADATEPA